jgi:hypothetical protein
MKVFLALPQVAVLLKKQKIFRSLGLSHPSLPQFLQDDSSSTTVPIPFRPTKSLMIVILACPYHDDHLEQAMPFSHLFLVFPFLQNLKYLMRERPFRLLQSLLDRNLFSLRSHRFCLPYSVNLMGTVGLEVTENHLVLASFPRHPCEPLVQETNYLLQDVRQVHHLRKNPGKTMTTNRKAST